MSKLTADVRNLFRSFMRVHILSFAAEEEVFGLSIRRRLRDLGYEVSPGLLYPALQDLERKGLLSSHWAVVAGKRRHNYRITMKGYAFLYHIKPLLDDLTQIVHRTEIPEEIS